MTQLLSVRERLLGFGDRQFVRLMVTPFAVAFVFAALVPVAVMVWYSFTDLSFSLPGHHGELVGTENFRRTLDDNRLWNSAYTTFAYIGVTLPLELFLGLGSALLLERDRLARRLLTPAISLPAIIAPVTVGLLWKLLLHGDYGPVASAARALGVNEASLLGNPRSAFYAVAFVDVWQWTPFFTLVLLASLRSIPREPYEAAMVDGARPVQIFTTITLPLLRPGIAVATIIRFVDWFKEFDKIFVLTHGGPGSSTEVLSVYAWIVSFEHGNFGYGAAVTLLMCAVVVTSCNILIWKARPDS